MLSTGQQVDWIVSFLDSLEKPVFLCSGNHDVLEHNLNENSLEDLFNIDDIETGYEIENDVLDDPVWLSDVSIKGCYLDGSIREIDGIAFGCLPYLSADFHKYRNCDVLLHHVPPANTKVSVGEGGIMGVKHSLPE